MWGNGTSLCCPWECELLSPFWKDISISVKMKNAPALLSGNVILGFVSCRVTGSVLRTTLGL